MQKQTSSTQHVIITAPAQRVLTFVSNVALWSQWIAEVVEVTPPPVELTVQSTFDVVFDIGGRHLPATCHVETLEPESRLRLAFTGGLDGEMSWKLQPEGAGTCLTWERRFVLPSWAGILGKIGDRWFIEQRLEKQQDAGLHKLKDILEGRA